MLLSNPVIVIARTKFKPRVSADGWADKGKSQKKIEN
jgi:hypothetical protein